MEEVSPGAETPIDAPVREIWLQPAITTFDPIAVTEGISNTPGDGISNLT